MRRLTTRWRRPCRMLRDAVAAPLSPFFATGWRRLRLFLVLAVSASSLAGTPALAQRSAVTVDLGALDTLGPTDPTAKSGSRIRLHRPAQPTPRSSTSPASGKSAPVQASNRSPASPPSASPPAASPPAPPATIPPSPLPAPQAALTPAVPPPAGSAAQPAPAAPPTAAPPSEAATTTVTERILFPPEDATLADDAKQELDRLAARLGADARLYVQLVAYASGGSDASQARRLSLSRALAARSYLVDHGVEIKQIDVRPLGNKSEPGGQPDRVDLVVTQR
jgi:outer membrane protein OmpA-like peptidoglycan-associated protein